MAAAELSATSQASAASARAGARLPDVLLLVGIALVVVEVGRATSGRGDPFVIAGHGATLVAASLVRLNRPDLPSSAWYAALGTLGAASGLTDQRLAALVEQGASPTRVNAANLVATEVGVLGTLALMLLIGSFPDGRLDTPRQRRLLTLGAGLACAVPVLATLATPVIPLPTYLDAPSVANPWHVLPVAITGGAGSALMGTSLMVVFLGPAVLVVRYRVADPRVQRRMRWLLLPVVFLVAGLTTIVFFPDGVPVALWVFLLVGLSGDIASTLGILAPDRADADSTLRRTIVFAVLWLLIALLCLGAATAVGVTAGRDLPLGWAVAIACVASLLFQPARTRLEGLADRWVFGRRSDPATVVARLGEILAGTFDLEDLLPRMARTLEQGLGLTWAQVRLDPAPRHGDAIHQLIALDGEVLGAVACGPKLSGAWTDSDRVVVETFAAQAALAVRNVRLTEHLAARATEVADSRARLVRAQEGERRRIERNIHDGVQQDLVALIGLAGIHRRSIERGGPLDPQVLVDDLGSLQAGMQQLLADLRELAAGVHPGVLSDHGLPAAVEALVTRHPVPARLTVERDLHGRRLPDEVEGAAYFIVAEALANSLKHSRAHHIEVALSRSNGSLVTTVRDDGVGFAAPSRVTGGLTSLGERANAMGGQLTVTSVPGEGTTVLARLPLAPARPAGVGG